MTPEQAQLVRLSFVKVMDIKDAAGRLFYDRLFTIAPDLRPMFKGDIDAQARKLMDTLAVAIGSLKDSVALTSMLEQLGQRHSRYGVKDEHYGQVGAALLWTLDKGLGEDFTPEVKAAWTALFAAVSTIMINAASRDKAVA
jgi:hemoglobin-like flavoprotein